MLRVIVLAGGHLPPLVLFIFVNVFTAGGGGTSSTTKKERPTRHEGPINQLIK